jgi:hypothetical protein
MDECQRLSQALRSENARLKDQVVALQAQNRDYAERAVDDLRRLAAREQAIEQLERGIQAYQEDRDRLGQAYARLAGSLGHSGRLDTPPDGPARSGATRPIERDYGVGDDRRSEGVTSADDGPTRR